MQKATFGPISTEVAPRDYTFEEDSGKHFRFLTSNNLTITPF